MKPPCTWRARGRKGAVHSVNMAGALLGYGMTECPGLNDRRSF